MSNAHKKRDRSRSVHSPVVTPYGAFIVFPRELEEAIAAHYIDSHNYTALRPCAREESTGPMTITFRSYGENNDDLECILQLLVDESVPFNGNFSRSPIDFNRRIMEIMHSSTITGSSIHDQMDKALAHIFANPICS